MTGIRSCRKLEAACRDQISFLWFTGWQHPDHNTLWRTRRWHAWQKGLIEPIFGILKEQLRARLFLLRGLANVRAEFMMLATAFNLRVPWRAWTSYQPPGPTKRSTITQLIML